MKYFRATGIGEAAMAAAEGAHPLAGGTVIVPDLAISGSYGKTFVDIGRISELAQISKCDGYLHIGSLVPLAQIATSPMIHPSLGAVVQAAAAVGNPQVRRVATIGGNVALGISTADVLTALHALDAEITCHSSAAEQIFPLTNFNSAGRLITGVRIPLHETRRSAFRKFAWRGASGITIVSVAVAISVNAMATPRVVAGGIGKKAQRLIRAEAILHEEALTADVAVRAGVTAAAEAVYELSGPPGAQYRGKLLQYGVRQMLAEVVNQS